MARDTIGRTFLVATVLCIVCSVLVSVAAVMLRPYQEANKSLDRKKNILIAAGLFDPKEQSAESLDKIFADRVNSVLVDLDTGDEVPESEVNPTTYDEREAAADPELSEEVDPPGALPGIARRAKYAFVYQVNDDSGKLSQVVLPIYGKGLWSTMYGFIALTADTETVNGITFYEQGETPGLGGEVENPAWKAQWKGKEVYGSNDQVRIEVIKGKVNPASDNAKYEIDGLSGATITTRGVSNLVRYWLGPDGFGPYLEKLREADAGTATAATTSQGVTDG